MLGTDTIYVTSNTTSVDGISISQAPVGDTPNQLIIDVEPVTPIQEADKANNVARLNLEAGALSVELQNRAPIADTRMDRVALWLTQNERAITGAAASYEVPAEAIAGAIAWEALENVSPWPSLTKWALGPGKVHPVPWLTKQRWLTSTAAQQVEQLGLITRTDDLTRIRLVQTTIGAVSYIAAILDSYAIAAEKAGLHPDIRNNPAILDTFYNGVVKHVPDAFGRIKPYFPANYAENRDSTYIMPLNAESWFRYAIRVDPGYTPEPGPTMGVWVRDHLTWLRQTVGVLR